MLYKIIKRLVRIFYGNMRVEGLEKLPENHVVIVGNHTQMNGPIAGELFMSDNCYIWCAGEMMNQNEVPDYAFTDFWSQKPKWTHPFYKVLSYLIAPFAVCIFNKFVSRGHTVHFGHICVQVKFNTLNFCVILFLYRFYGIHRSCRDNILT